MLIASAAAETLFIVASVCIVLLTIAALVVAYAVVKAIKEAQRLAARIEGEAMRVVEWQQKLDRNARFAGKWLRIMGEHFISGRD